MYINCLLRCIRRGNGRVEPPGDEEEGNTVVLYHHRLYRLRGNLHNYAQYWHSLLWIPTLAMGEGRRKSVDLALQTSVLGIKTLHSTAEVTDNKAGGGCAMNDCIDARAQAKH